ncbi:MAG: extracellular solute-binding protein [Christensenellales bacterium]|jgi:raffinose/stachyose/melibiose transport system substrate-binding protein
MKKALTLLMALMMFIAIAVPAMAEEPVELDLFVFHTRENRGSSSECDTFWKRVDEWKEAHPEVTIKESTMDQADYHVKCQAMAAAGKIADMIFVKGSWFTTFVENELLLPLSEIIEAYEHKDAWRSGIFDAGIRDGVIYGIPNQFATTSLVYYNAKMFEEIGYDHFPITWDEFFDAAAKFEEKGIDMVALGNKDKWPAESCILSALGHRFTGLDWTNSIIAKDGEAKFTDQAFIDALALLQRMSTEGLLNADYNTITNGQAQAYVYNGKAACTFEGFWAVASFNAEGDPAVMENIEVALMPTIDGTNTNSTSGGAGWYMGLSSGLEGAKKDAALDFLFYVYGIGYSEDLSGNYGDLAPMVVEVADTSTLPPLTVKALACLDGVVFTPIYDILMEGSVIDVMNAGLQELLNGTKTPEDLAAEIQFEQDML